MIENKTPLLIDPVEEESHIYTRGEILLATGHIEENDNLTFDISESQQLAINGVFVMFKFLIAIFIFAICHQSMLVILGCFGLILTCIEYRYELWNALKCWHSSYVWGIKENK